MLPAPIDYTDKDFDALRARLVALTRTAFPDWNDFSVASFGNLLLEMYAFVGDVITYYLDNQARESRLATATQRRNVIALARMLGYKLHGARAATAEALFHLAQSPAADVLIPAGTVVRTQEVTEPVRFQLLADVRITAGADPPEATGVIEHSQTHTQLRDAHGLAYLDVVLDRTPYLDGSAIVSAPGSEFTEVDSLQGSGPNDRHFMVLVDQNDRATIRQRRQWSRAVRNRTGHVQDRWRQRRQYRRRTAGRARRRVLRHPRPAGPDFGHQSRASVRRDRAPDRSVGKAPA